MLRIPRPPRSPNKEPSATLAASWLGSDSHAAQVLETARNLMAAEHVLKNILPPAMASVCRVARLDRQQITLAVPSAAYASKLRQLAPRVLLLLNDNGWNLNEISIRVQAALLKSRTKTAPRQVEPLGKQALHAFAELQGSLQPGPLADAVARLLANHRKP